MAGRSQESAARHRELRKRKRQARIAKEGLEWTIAVDNPHRKKVLVKGKKVLVRARSPSQHSSQGDEGASPNNSEDSEDSEKIENQECINAIETAIEENAKNPFFNRLPLEIRLTIYEFAMLTKEDIIVGGDTLANSRFEKKRRIVKRPVPNFLYTSRQVLAETNDILNKNFYAVNEFWFLKTYARDPYLFMERLGKENFQVISFITFNAISTESTRFVFENVTSLKRLRFSDDDYSPRNMREKFKHWVPLMRRLCAGSSGVKHIVLDPLYGMTAGFNSLIFMSFKKSKFPTTLQGLEDEFNNLLEH